MINYCQTYKEFKKLLEESEKQVSESKIYHFTYLSSAYEILDSNKLMSRHGELNSNYPFISFTSNIDFYKKGIAGFKPNRRACAFELDSTKMKNDNLNLFYFEYKSIKNKNYSNELEIRYKGPDINILKYINKIYLFHRNIKDSDSHFLEKLKNIANKNNIEIIDIQK